MKDDVKEKLLDLCNHLITEMRPRPRPNTPWTEHVDTRALAQMVNASATGVVLPVLAYALRDVLDPMVQPEHDPNAGWRGGAGEACRCPLCDEAPSVALRNLGAALGRVLLVDSWPPERSCYPGWSRVGG